MGKAIAIDGQSASGYLSVLKDVAGYGAIGRKGGGRS